MTQPVPPLPTLPPDAIPTIQFYAQDLAWLISAEEQELIANAIRLVAMPLGDPGRLDATRVAWQSTAAGAVATSTNGLRQAKITLKPLWEGPAAESYDGYTGGVIEQSDVVQAALADVGTALGDAHQQIYNTIVAVMGFVTEAAATILEFVGDFVSRLIPPLVIQAVLNALAKLARAFGMALEQATMIIAGYKDAARRAMAVIVGLGMKQVIPTLPTAAYDPNLYQPVAAPDGPDSDNSESDGG